MKLACLLAAPLYILATAAGAGTADYIHAPVVEKGETEIGVKFGALRRARSGPETAAAFGIGHGVTSWWSTEVYALYDHGSGRGTAFEGIEWENTFQLTPAGRYMIDLGFISELERSRDRSDGYEHVFGPLFQKDFGPTRINLNILFSQHYRTEERMRTGLGYQFQARHAIDDDLGVGMQAFGEVGQWNNWATRREQSHRIGPAIFSALDLGDDHRLVYEAALLFEAANRDRGKTLRASVSYEF